MGARRIFCKGDFFLKKKLTTFLVVALKTQVLTVTASTETLYNILQHSPLPLPAAPIITVTKTISLLLDKTRQLKNRT